MSQAKLTLRPPPNVDFVHGFPGIPPGPPDRPHASVTGAVELRLGGAPIKAKWVRVELRKIEELPSGQQFVDFVGQSPLNVWQSRDGDWAVLEQGQDFPFVIRIPESIPPSIQLDKGGIRYELQASVCVKGKKGLLRRDASPTIISVAHILIDKHELHSTWPVYQQPDVRQISENYVTLTVERAQSCYGPGDRVAVVATTISDNMSPIVIRGFEFTLMETLVFRPATGPGHNKKTAPQTRMSAIGEQRAPAAHTLYAGQMHKMELFCVIPATHTNTTVVTARHIDIGYFIRIVVLLENLKPMAMDIPVTVSNWPRTVSMQALQRIGAPPAALDHPSRQHLHTQPTPSLSGHPGQPQAFQNPGFGGAQPAPNAGYQVPGQANGRPPSAGGSDAGHTQAGSAYYGSGRPGGQADEMGFRPPGAQLATVTENQGYPAASLAGAGARPANGMNQPGVNPQTDLTPAQLAARKPFMTAEEEKARLRGGARPAQSSTPAPSAAPAPAPVPTPVPAPAPFVERPAPQRAPSVQATPTPAPAPAPTIAASQSASQAPWLSASEEKKRYEQARTAAERLQRQAAGDIAPERKPSISGADYAQSYNYAGGSSSAAPVSTPPPTAPAASSASKSAWPSAEEEKARYERARAAAERTQAFANPYEGSGSSGSSYQAPAKSGISTGAALYAQAMSAVKNAAATPPPPRDISPPPAAVPSYSPPPAGGSQNASGSSRAPAPAPAKPWLTAEEEKASLRYYEAKRAVELHSNQVDPGPNDPVPYDYMQPPSPPPAATMSSQRSRAGTSSPPAGSSSAAPPAAYDLPPPFAAAPQGAHAITSALQEKERLRQAYEQQDRGSQRQQNGNASSAPPGYGLPPPASPPPPSNSYNVPQDPPMFDGGGYGAPPPRIMTAAEEKALLKAQYQNEGRSSNATPQYSAPPPAAPPSAGLPRSPPPPPRGGSGMVPMSAAEEKARLQAQYSSQSTPPPPGNWGSSSSSSGYAQNGAIDDYRDPTISQGKKAAFSPPPLMPKPPAHYIAETRREDLRSSTLPWPDEEPVDYSLDYKPGTPFHLELEDSGGYQGSGGQSHRLY